MRVCVIIPTTDGPAAIMRLVRLHKAPLSVMRTQDDYRALPPSPRYHEFTQPGGPLRKFLTLPDDRFELRVAARIESGRSWELPVALAHWLEAEGHELVSEDPDLVVWATGALDNDLKIIPQNYHLEQKLSGSMESLAEYQEQGSGILLLPPELIEPPSHFDSDSVSLQVVQGLTQAIGVIAEAFVVVEPDGRIDAAPKVHGKSVKRTNWLWVSLTAVALVLGGALAVPRLINLSPAQPADESGFGALPITENDPAPDNGGAEQETAILSTPAPLLEEDIDDGEPGAETLDQREAVSLVALESPPLRSTVPRLVLDYAPEGASCPDVLFGTTAPRTEYRTATDDGYGRVSPLELCAVGVQHSADADHTLELLPPDELERHVLSADWQGGRALEPGGVAMFRLRAAVPVDFAGHWTFEGSSNGSMDVSFELFSAQ